MDRSEGNSECPENQPSGRNYVEYLGAADLVLGECVGDPVAQGEGGEGAAGGEERPSAGPPDGSRDGFLGHGQKERITGLLGVHGGGGPQWARHGGRHTLIGWDENFIRTLLTTIAGYPRCHATLRKVATITRGRSLITGPRTRSPRTNRSS